MINSVTRKLMAIAYDKGFSVILDDRFTSHTPSAANPFTNTIVINENWYKPEQLSFQLAHELGHLINKDMTNVCLYFSPSKSGIEGNANRTAIRLLLPIYLDGKDKEQVNITKFMGDLDMPHYLEDMVEKEILNYYD
ncbi:ImmA/IrrE family metallo-endopeptidase [Companilactobacillus farciminis]|uniref:ImmA/IrrE family metallo-endopeptidase n=1 Tax=Companilactobacillus farciminis TaxID=1612 RepID=UPI0023310B59|nr:ImmA/IrrE family metallo-endopeptidase [Companilactobacillus farciminis]WCG36369.1 ImmA/IrrE family metallo-endopeptidase [Companilactobacillus farciminis]